MAGGVTDSYIVRDLCATLGLPSARAFFALERWERSEWFVWWRHKHGMVSKVVEPRRAPRTPRKAKDTEALQPSKGVNATSSGRAFWLGG